MYNKEETTGDDNYYFKLKVHLAIAGLCIAALLVFLATATTVVTIAVFIFIATLPNLPVLTITVISVLVNIFPAVIGASICALLLITATNLKHKLQAPTIEKSDETSSLVVPEESQEVSGSWCSWFKEKLDASGWVIGKIQKTSENEVLERSLSAL